MLRMRSAGGFLILAVIISVCPRQVLGASNLPTNPVVTVASYDWKGDLVAQGAGFFIDAEGGLITATGLLEGGVLTEVRGQDGSLHVVSIVVAVDAYGGLSRVRLETVPGSFMPLSMATGIPANGSTVLVLRPGGAVEACRLRETRTFPGIDEFTLMRFATPAAGPPGSPILDLSGRVTGVTVQSMEDEPSWTLATSTESVRLLAENREGGVPYQEWARSGDGAWGASYIAAVLRGVAYASLGDGQRARPALEEATRHGVGTCEEVYARLGDLEAAAGRLEEAQRHYERADSMSPGRQDLHERLAYVQLSRGFGDQAEATARSAVAAFPEDGASHVLLSRVLNSRGRHEEALRVALSATKAHPKDAGLWGQAAAACIGMGLFEEAVAHGMRATEQDRNDAEAFSNLGYASLRSGQPLRAIVALRRAAELAPDEGEVRKTLAEAYSLAGLSGRAMAAYRIAICIDPSDWQAYWRLADACLAAGDTDEAAAVCQQAVSRCPDNAWLRFKLGKARCGGGDVDGAAREVRALEAINVELARQLRLLVERLEVDSGGWKVF